MFNALRLKFMERIIHLPTSISPPLIKIYIFVLCSISNHVCFSPTNNLFLGVLTTIKDGIQVRERYPSNNLIELNESFGTMEFTSVNAKIDSSSTWMDEKFEIVSNQCQIHGLLEVILDYNCQLALAQAA